jgi:hypothetical protein
MPPLLLLLLLWQQPTAMRQWQPLSSAATWRIPEISHYLGHVFLVTVTSQCKI